MNSLLVSLFLTILIISFCINNSREDNVVDEFDQWFNKNLNKDNDNQFGPKDVFGDNSSADYASVPQILSTTAIEGISTQSETAINILAPIMATTTTTTTTTITTTTTPITTPTTTPITTTTTIPSTTTSTTTTTSIPTIPTKWATVDVTTQATTDPGIETTFKPMSDCLRITLNTKVIFKYNLTDGIVQQIELSAGNTNGELVQTNQCQRSQDLVIKFEMLGKTRLILG